MNDRLIVDRLEDMSPNGRLILLIEDDGDVIVTCQEGDEHGGPQGATVQFCTPFAGGGGSHRTFKALRALAIAMAEDNADAGLQHRTGNAPGERILKRARG
jgi:hypothetical protein